MYKSIFTCILFGYMYPRRTNLYSLKTSTTLIEYMHIDQIVSYHFYVFPLLLKIMIRATMKNESWARHPRR